MYWRIFSCYIYQYAIWETPKGYAIRKYGSLHSTHSIYRTRTNILYIYLVYCMYIRVQRFYNLVLPGRWWMQNFILKSNIGVKKRRIRIRWKRCKKSHAKKVITEKWSFWIFSTVWKGFPPKTFLRTFCTFSTDPNSALNFAFFTAHIEFQIFCAYISTFC